MPVPMIAPMPKRGQVERADRLLERVPLLAGLGDQLVGALPRPDVDVGRYGHTYLPPLTDRIFHQWRRIRRQASAASRRSRSDSSFQAPTEARRYGVPGRLRTATPASREPVARRPRGSGSSQRHERRRGARRDACGRRSASRSASSAARSRRAGVDGVPARAPRARRSAASRERRRLAREPACRSGARRSCSARLEAARGVLEGEVAGRDRAHALAELRREVEHPGAVGAAQPLLAGGGVGGAAERLDVDRHRAGALRAVEDHRHVDARPARRARARR